MNALDALLADLAETLANAALALDTGARERLAALDGRRVQILCTAPAKTLMLAVQGERLSVSAEALQQAHVTVKGSAADLLAWLAVDAESGAEKVEIDGDRTILLALAEIFDRGSLGRAFKALADRLPAVQGEDILGALEVAAAAAQSVAEGAATGLQRLAGRAALNASAVDDFGAAVADLSERTDRLVDRVRALEAQLSDKLRNP